MLVNFFQLPVHWNPIQTFEKLTKILLKESEIEKTDPDTIKPEILNLVEADVYWCLSRFLDGIQNNYTFAQPGIQRMVHKLSELIHRVDGKQSKKQGREIRNADVMFCSVQNKSQSTSTNTCKMKT